MPPEILDSYQQERRAHVIAKSEAILSADLPVEVTGQGTPNASMPSAAGESSSSDAVTLARQLFQIAKRDPKLKVLPAVERLYGELARRGIRFRPHCWLAEEWFSPDGVPGIAIPFYLAHPRLARLETSGCRF